MSEYQYVHFIACDKPLDEKQLLFMRKQSSRATITRRDFTNEYNFGDFHGNAVEMLRHGYDIHLHYANFGIRKLMLRLPGLPWDKKTLARYTPETGFKVHKDKSGSAVILEINPQADAGSFYENILDLDPLQDAIPQVRDLLIAGDLRFLYLVWLAMNQLDGNLEAIEPPIPAGMSDLPDCLVELADFYDLDSDLLDAAAEGSPPLATSADPYAGTNAWLARQSNDDLKELARRFLTEDPISIRTEIQTRIRKAVGADVWPVAELSRTLQQLRVLADEIELRRTRKEADAKDKAKRERLKKIAANPDAVIKDVESLISQRSTDSYSRAAKLLVELSEALGPVEGPQKARAVAESLRQQYSTWRQLINVLKKFGLLPKRAARRDR